MSYYIHRTSAVIRHRACRLTRDGLLAHSVTSRFDKDEEQKKGSYQRCISRRRDKQIDGLFVTHVYGLFITQAVTVTEPTTAVPPRRQFAVTDRQTNRQIS